MDKRRICLTSLVALLPALAGILLWDRLPDRMPTHFDFRGVPDGWSGKPFAVLGLPLFLLATHLLCLFAVSMDPKRRNVSGKVHALTLWICPAISVLVGVLTYGSVLGGGDRIDVTGIGLAATGILFLIVGNWLPKCRQNYTVGIKLPWTLADEDNWDRTHRLAGPLWMAGGAVLLLDALLDPLPEGGRMALVLSVLFAAGILPTVYSAWLWWRRQRTVS